MSPFRTVALLACCLMWSGPVTALSQPKSVVAAKGKPVAKAPKAGRRKPARKNNAAAVPKTGAACDTPEQPTRAASTPPVPVAADPLAPTVTPCPPGTKVPATAH